MIEVENLTKQYGDKTVVDHISFTINDGEVLGFLGPNGAGKSTTMNMITGYLSSTSGTVKISGHDILEEPIEAKKHIGYLPELPPLYMDMTVREYLNFMYELKKVKLPRAQHIAEICRTVKIEHVYNRLIKNLSKGYRQRVGIAQAMLGNPDVLILDEPTVGLDPQQIIDIRNLISDLGKKHTIILSSHILSEVQAVCERVIVINKGALIANGTPESLSKQIKGEARIHATIVGSNKDVQNIIEHMSGVQKVVCLGSKDGTSYEYEITPKADKDIRGDLFNEMSATSHQIIELKNTNMNLEDIFLQLVEDAPAKAESDNQTKKKRFFSFGKKKGDK